MKGFVTEVDLTDEVYLFDMDSILNNSTRTKKPIISGVYFLIYLGKIVYVGSSYDVHLRMETHRKNPQLKYNAYFIHPVYNPWNVGDANDARKEIEKRYIIKYRPRFNFMNNPDYADGKKKILKNYLNHFSCLQDVVDICEIPVSTSTVSGVLTNPENSNKEIKMYVESAIMSRSKKHKKLKDL